MPRHAITGNGNMLLNYEHDMTIREVYYPHVGMHSQTGNTGHRTYLWCGGRAFSLSELNPRTCYEQDSTVLRSEALARDAGIQLSLRDAVHFERNVWCRCLSLKNESPATQNVGIYLVLDTCLDASDIGDTALLDPVSGGILHYKSNTFMLVSQAASEEARCVRTTCVRRDAREYPELRLAAEGMLHERPASQGCVYSVLGMVLELGPGARADASMWFVFSDSVQRARELDTWVKRCGACSLIDTTHHYWRSWLLAAHTPDTDLSEDAHDLYRRSILSVRLECDNRGGILAANDRDMLEHGRDHYSYVWPRDAALSATAMCRAGFSQIAARFLEFCTRTVTDEGYLCQRYRPDGSLGSSWHAWRHNSRLLPPIQEDETALSLWAFGEYVFRTQDLEFFRAHHNQFFKMADFLLCYTDENTSLPLPSHDLWEERYGVFSFTIAAVYGALQKAARLYALVGNSTKSMQCLEAAQRMKTSWLNQFYCETHCSFARAMYTEDGKQVLDMVPDSSLHGVWMFGLLDLHDPRLIAGLDTVEAALLVKSRAGGLARYQDDWYMKVTDDTALVPGNPWIVCTLWAASRHARLRRDEQDVLRAKELLEWAVTHTNGCSMLPEQVDPFSGAALSVSPLTWSHAEFISAYLDYAQSFQAKTDA